MPSRPMPSQASQPKQFARKIVGKQILWNRLTDITVVGRSECLRVCVHVSRPPPPVFSRQLRIDLN